MRTELGSWRRAWRRVGKAEWRWKLMPTWSRRNWRRRRGGGRGGGGGGGQLVEEEDEEDAAGKRSDKI